MGPIPGNCSVTHNGGSSLYDAIGVIKNVLFTYELKIAILSPHSCIKYNVVGASHAGSYLPGGLVSALDEVIKLEKG